MAPILARPSQSLPAASSDGDEDSSSTDNEVEQQSTTMSLSLRPPPPPPPTRPQGEGEEEEEESSSEGEDLELESSEELVAHGTPTKKSLVVASPPPQNERKVSDSDSDEVEDQESSDSEEAPPVPALQAKKKAPPSSSDDEVDQGSDSEEAPPVPAPQPEKNASPELNGKRKTPPPPEAGESPQRKRKVLQAEVTTPAQDDIHQGRNRGGSTDVEKQFKEKAAFYFHLGKEVSALDEEHPDLFKEAFLKLSDDKASAMDNKIKKLRLTEVTVSMRRQGLEKDVIKLLLDLLKSS
uniref:Uncharacterized protein n=1 Tax=Leersia perrieri TaxID=77586 RepID=A0A0D9XBF8_9ORYZ